MNRRTKWVFSYQVYEGMRYVDDSSVHYIERGAHGRVTSMIRTMLLHRSYQHEWSVFKKILKAHNNADHLTDNLVTPVIREQINALRWMQRWRELGLIKEDEHE